MAMQPTPHALLRDTRGVSTVEYALLLVAILLVGAAGFRLLGTGIKKQAECAANFGGTCGGGEGAAARSEWRMGGALTASEESQGVQMMAKGAPASPSAGSDQALADVKAAEERWSKGAHSRQEDVSRTAQLARARDELKEAIKAEGADAILARHPNDPAVRAQIEQAKLDIAKDNLAAQEAKGQSDELVKAREQVLKGEQIELPRALNDRVLDMRKHGMSRTEALEQLRNEGYGAGLGFTSDTLDKGQMPTTIGMTDAERGAYYEKNFLDNPATSEEAKRAYQSGQPVIVGIHHASALDANDGKGVFDDRFVVLQKSDGNVSSREFNASLDPNLSYGLDATRQHYDQTALAPDAPIGKYATRDRPEFCAYGPILCNGVTAPSRLADGQTIQLSTGPNKGGDANERLYTPSKGGYTMQGDLNGDGIFGNDGPRDTKKAPKNDFQFHAGKADYSHTGTDGCLSMPYYQWNDFRSASGLFNGSEDQRTNQPGHIYYTQMSESSLHP